MDPHDVWSSQCEAARGILDQLRTEKALGYVVGEKFLNFLEAAETDPEWAAAVPDFAGEIRRIFEPWQLKVYSETDRRLGALGHAADEEMHVVLRSQPGDQALLREDARNLLLLERGEGVVAGRTGRRRNVSFLACARLVRLDAARGRSGAWRSS